MFTSTTVNILPRILLGVLVFLATISPSFSSSSHSLGMNTMTLRDSLEAKVRKLFSEIETLPVSISRKGIQVRTKWEGNIMLALGEAKYTPHHPRKFRSFLENFSEDFPKVNPMARKVHIIKKDKESRVGMKSELKFPFPLTDRLMIFWAHKCLDRSPDEHLLLLSEEDNQDLVKEFHTQEEKDRYVLGRTFLCAYWVRPVFCEKDKSKIIGSSVRYAYSGDTGGSVPKMLQDLIGPKTAFDSVNGLIKFVSDDKNVANEKSEEKET